MTWLNPLDEAHFAVLTIQASSQSKVNLIRNTRDSHKISGWCFCGSWVSIEENWLFHSTHSPMWVTTTLFTRWEHFTRYWVQSIMNSRSSLPSLCKRSKATKKMTWLTVRRCGLNPEYWGLPKISGQWFLWLMSYWWRKSAIWFDPTALQGNKPIAWLNP